MLTATRAVQNLTATDFLLLIHCDTPEIAVHLPREGSFRACFSKLKIWQIEQQYQTQHKCLPDTGITGWEEVTKDVEGSLSSDHY